jgi:2-succinyl-6-hydroxy-2,4-cyclohexadiene-1-carboxylate synthase
VTPLALLHGFTGTPASWDDALAALPATRALRPALLGHAPESDATQSVQTFDDEIVRLATLLPSEPVHLAGYSLGARLALALAVAHPERIARLTLVSGQPGLASAAEREVRRQADARWCALLESRGIEPFVAEWEALPLFATQARLPAALRARRRRERLSHDPTGLARSLRTTGLAEMPDLAPALPRLHVPVTLLAGALDPKFTAIAEQLASKLPHARLVIVPNAGHDLLLEAPSVVAGAIGE